MKEVVIVSGKGGTGKTSIASSLAKLIERKVIVDADVDAPDLHIILKPDIRKKNPFYGMKRARIIKEKCTRCHLCIDRCRFDAISEDYEVDPIACDGCKVCYYICPPKAIVMEDVIAGYWFLSETKYGPFYHGILEIGEENSGKLIAYIRRQAQITASKDDFPIILTDGPPGTGCPVNSSLTGAHIGIAVAEPTRSGLHDMKRIIDVIEHFHVKPLIIVNKFDINEKISKEIEDYLRERRIELLGKIPFDPAVTKAQVMGIPVVSLNNSPAAEAIKRIYEKLKPHLYSS